MRSALALALAFALLAGAWSCTRSPAHEPSEPALAEVHSPRLRGHMGELEQVAIADLADATRGRALRSELVRIAADLEGIAARLPDVVPTLGLDAENRSHFVTFSDALAGSAARLRLAAPSEPAPVVEARIDEVTQACAGCHWAFRADPDVPQP